MLNLHRKTWKCNYQCRFQDEVTFSLDFWGSYYGNVIKKKKNSRDNVHSYVTYKISFGGW